MTIANSPGLFESALEHRMGGLLLSAIRRVDGAAAPDWANALEVIDLGVRGDHQRLWNALDVLCHRLAGIGVDFAGAKGVPAEKRWYDRTGERPCADIDIVLAPDHRDRFADVLRAIEPQHPVATAAGRLAERGLLQSLEARLDGTGEQVDVHVDLMKLGVSLPFDDAAWQRLESVTLPSGAPLRVLDAESQLVHFAVHVNKGRFPHLLGYVDILRLAGLPSLDVDAVFRLAAQSGIETHVRSTIESVHADVGLTSPLGRAHGTASLVWSALWPAPSRLRGPEAIARSHPRRDHLFLLSVARPPWQALRFLWHRAFPSEDSRVVASWGTNTRSVLATWRARLRRRRRDR